MTVSPAASMSEATAARIARALEWQVALYALNHDLSSSYEGLLDEHADEEDVS
jgi:hypothetical protein